MRKFGHTHAYRVKLRPQLTAGLRMGALASVWNGRPFRCPVGRPLRGNRGGWDSRPGSADRLSAKDARSQASPGPPRSRLPQGPVAGWMAGRLIQHGARGGQRSGRFLATVSRRADQLPKKHHSEREPMVARNLRRGPTSARPRHHRSETPSRTACKDERVQGGDQIREPVAAIPEVALEVVAMPR